MAAPPIKPSVDELRERVVQAARSWLRDERRRGLEPSFKEPGALADAIDALDKATGPMFRVEHAPFAAGPHSARVVDRGGSLRAICPFEMDAELICALLLNHFETWPAGKCPFCNLPLHGLSGPCRGCGKIA
jgi:hypothetical protein